MDNATTLPTTTTTPAPADAPEEVKKETVNVMEVRILIDNSQVGGIIGKKGANVKAIREQTGVYLSILKSDFRNVQERILILKGGIESIASAVKEVTKLMIESQSKKDGVTPESIAVRLLVHRAVIGAIIGRGGQTIKDLQAKTTTRVQISTEALPNSYEKSVTVIGNADSIEAAFNTILTQLHDNPLKPGTKSFPYVPGVMPTALYNQQPFMGGGYGMMQQPAYPHQPASVFAQGPSSTQKIAIPTVCAGCVIGKGGAVIRDIRIQSSTTISIEDPDELTPQERVVTIAGSPQGIQAAIYLIRQLVEQYQPPPQTQQMPPQQAHVGIPPQIPPQIPMQSDMGLARAMGNLQMDPYAGQHPQY